MLFQSWKQRFDFTPDNVTCTEAANEVFCKKFVLNTFSKLTGKQPMPATLFKKQTPAQVYSCEFCETFKNAHFIEHLWVTASTCSNAHPKHLIKVSKWFFLKRLHKKFKRVLTYVLAIKLCWKRTCYSNPFMSHTYQQLKIIHSI